MSLQSEILDGLSIPDWAQSRDVVKRRVGDALRRLDPRSELTDTQYFNHSFVPDFVVSWSDPAPRTRDVFLRLDDRQGSIAEDVRSLDTGGPIIVGLRGLPDTSGASELATPGAPKSMVTSPDAVEHLGLKPGTFGHVLPAAMLHGGRGLVKHGLASELVDAAASFFSSSRAHDGNDVIVSANRLTPSLGNDSGDKLLNLGRTIWEATNTSGELFPLATSLSGVDDSGLRFLLEEAPTEDRDFWRSVGRTVSLETLTRLGTGDFAGLKHLMRANSDRLLAKVLAVRPAYGRLLEAGPEWAIESGAVVLRGTNFSAYVSWSREQLRLDPIVRSPLSFQEFVVRTRHERVDTVQIGTADGKRVSVQSDELFDPTTDGTLASVGSLPGSVIAGVGITVEARHLECDFIQLTASGRTNAQFDVTALLARGLPLLWPITDPQDRSELDALATLPSGPQEARLFDDY